MFCRSSVELMSRRLDGLLEPPDAARLDDHLAGCVSCRSQWAALREADSLLRVSARRPVASPADLTARIMTRVAATPVVRPQFWERDAQLVRGGRRTVDLSRTPAITGHLVPLPTQGAAPSGLGGFLQHFHPLRNARISVYLGGLSLAGALSMFLLVVMSTLWSTGLPAGAVLNGLTGGGTAETASTWLTAGWAVLNSLLAQINPWMAAVATLLVAGLGAAWWRIVAAVARRARRESLA
ncbi:MAG TPA: zf-HC2 domain-containing protein [Chloroflexia bacterium]|nr:zf-HC2 domain-containing protein [Chloroflexia bacterium]